MRCLVLLKLLPLGRINSTSFMLPCTGTVVIVMSGTLWGTNNFRPEYLKLSQDTSNFQPHTVGRLKTTSVVPSCTGTVVIGKIGTLWATYNFTLEHLKLVQVTSHS